MSSDRVSFSLSRVGATIGIIVAMLAGGTGLYGSLVLTPYRLDEAEQQLGELRREQQDLWRKQQELREVIIRVDTNVQLLLRRDGLASKE